MKAVTSSLTMLPACSDDSVDKPTCNEERENSIVRFGLLTAARWHIAGAEQDLKRAWKVLEDAMGLERVERRKKYSTNPGAWGIPRDLLGD